MQKQRQLVSEAKLRIRGIGKQIADLKREKYYIEQFIMQDEYITATRKNNLNKGLATKLKYGQKHKKDILKAVMGSEV
jgi:hypothetical protein